MHYDFSKENLPEAVGMTLERADELIVLFLGVYDSLGADDKEDEKYYARNKLYGLTAKHIKTIGEAYFMGSYIEFFLQEQLE